MKINWIEIKSWIKIKIYWNKKALWVPLWCFTIKRLYKVNNNDHNELKDSLIKRKKRKRLARMKRRWTLPRNV